MSLRKHILPSELVKIILFIIDEWFISSLSPILNSVNRVSVAFMNGLFAVKWIYALS